LHAPEVVCIAKGKARTPYEFGAKIGIAVTNREGLVLAAKAFVGNPYDGHTLAETLDQATFVSGVAPERIYVDKGYRGHNYTGAGEVMIAGRRRGLGDRAPGRHRPQDGAQIHRARFGAAALWAAQPRVRHLEPFELYLRQRVATYPGLTGSRLLREIRERGYEGG
jgi:hypothetical protein